MLQPNSVVIVGAGQAGQHLATSLRRRGHSGEIILIDASNVAPYQRPPLSKGHLSGELTDDDLMLEEPGFYEKHGISLRLGVGVRAIDRRAREVELENGSRVAYGHLVLATGARNRRLAPITTASRRVLQLRDIRESHALRQAANRAEEVVIIGGGFIGLEVAGTLSRTGVRIHVVEVLGRLLDRAVSPLLARAIRQHHEAKGITFHFNRTVALIEEENDSEFTVTLDDGSVLQADCVLAAIGVTPETALAEACGLETANGIVVNSALVTSDPNISAIGDCCVFPAHGRTVRLESVQNAVSHANHVAARLMGEHGGEFRDIPTFWSEQGGLLIQIAGLSERSDFSVTRGNPDDRSFSIFRFRDEHLVAVESLNRGGDHMLGRSLLAAGVSPTPEEVQDLSLNLRNLLVQTA